MPSPLPKAVRRLARRWLPPAVKDLFAPRDTGPVPPVVPFALPEIALDDLAPGAATATVSIPMTEWERTRDMVLPLPDLLAVAAICRAIRPRRIFEMGTFNGSTTLVMALNAPEADIFTLDLPREELSPVMQARFTAGSRFHGLPAARRITQLFGRSESYDYTPYRGTIDLVYVDAVHTYEAVQRDTVTALTLLRPGGLIVWDDYRWLPEHHECSGVTRWLNEMAAIHPVRQLRGTRLAGYRPNGGT